MPYNIFTNFDYINQQLAQNPLHYLKILYPQGFLDGREFKPLGKECTLSINIKTLIWNRFSEGRTGKNILFLYAYTHNIHIREASIQLCKILGLNPNDKQAPLHKINSHIITPIIENTNAIEDNAEALEKKRKFYYSLWQEAQSVYNTPAVEYLHARALVTEQHHEMRYHPKMLIRTDDITQKKYYYPCLLTPITNIDGRFMGLFRTFINPDNPKDYKAIRDKNHPITQGIYKGLLGSPKGGAVKFGHVQYRNHNNVIILTEGIEDALSAYQTIDETDVNKGIFGLEHKTYSVWAFLGTSHLQNLQIPKDANVILVIDNDDAGKESEKKFNQKMKLENIQYQAIMTKKYKDLNSLHIAKNKKNRDVNQKENTPTTI